MRTQYECLEEFKWEEGGRLIAHYLPGLTYSTTDSPVDLPLRAKMPEWVAAGRFREVKRQALSAAQASIGGVASVQKKEK